MISNDNGQLSENELVPSCTLEIWGDSQAAPNNLIPQSVLQSYATDLCYPDEIWLLKHVVLCMIDHGSDQPQRENRQRILTLE